LLLRGLKLALEDDRNKEVKEDEADNHDETREVGICYHGSTAIDSITLLIIITLIMRAPEKGFSRPCTIVHDILPAFTSCDTEEREYGVTEVLEVCMRIKMFL